MPELEGIRCTNYVLGQTGVPSSYGCGEKYVAFQCGQMGARYYLFYPPHSAIVTNQ